MRIWDGAINTCQPLRPFGICSYEPNSRVQMRYVLSNNWKLTYLKMCLNQFFNSISHYHRTSSWDGKNVILKINNFEFKSHIYNELLHFYTRWVPCVPEEWGPCNHIYRYSWTLEPHHQNHILSIKYINAYTFFPVEHGLMHSRTHLNLVSP